MKFSSHLSFYILKSRSNRSSARESGSPAENPDKCTRRVQQIELAWRCVFERISLVKSVTNDGYARYSIPKWR